MNTSMLSNVVAALLPFSSYGLPQQGNYSSYVNNTRQSYISTDVLQGNSNINSHDSSTSNVAHESDLQLMQNQATRTLVIVDSAVPDKAVFQQQAGPGIEVVELNSKSDGLEQIKQILAQYQDLDALHLVSHANSGELLLGDATYDSSALEQEFQFFAQLNHALKPGADVHFYGCNLAKGEKGEEFLTLITNNAHVDVAASDNLTGNSQLEGDWDLEIRKGDIDSASFAANTVQDFSSVLQVDSNSTVNGMPDFNGLYSSDPQPYGVSTVSADIRYEDSSYNFIDTGFDLTVASFLDSAPVNSLACVEAGCVSFRTDFFYGSGPVPDEVRVYLNDNVQFDVQDLVFEGYNGSFGDYRITSSAGQSVMLSGTSLEIMDGRSSFEVVQPNFSNITSFSIRRTDGQPFSGVLILSQISLENIGAAPSGPDSDVTLTAGNGVTEPVTIDSATSISSPIEIFDFTITDGGTSDGLAFDVSAITLDTSGSTIAVDQLSYRLNGLGVDNAVGTVNPDGTVLFDGLALSVPNGAVETYTVSVFFADGQNSNLVEGQTLVLSTDIDTDFVVSESGSQSAGSLTVSNGSGSVLTVEATQLTYLVEPGDTSVSGQLFTTQPVVAAVDDFGNVDIDFAEEITVSGNISGSFLGATTSVAVNGVATFVDLGYNAVVDNQSLDMVANDDAVNGTLLSATTNTTVEVIATQLAVQRPSAIDAPIQLDANYVFNPLTGVFSNAFVSDSISSFLVFGIDDNGAIDADYDAGDVTVRQTNTTDFITVLSGPLDLDNDPSTYTVATDQTNNSVLFQFDSVTVRPNTGSATATLVVSNQDSAIGDLVVVEQLVQISPSLYESEQGVGPFEVAVNSSVTLDTTEILIDNTGQFDESSTSQRFYIDAQVDFGAIELIEDGLSAIPNLSFVNNEDGSITASGSLAALRTFLSVPRFRYVPTVNSTQPATFSVGNRLTASDLEFAISVVSDGFFNTPPVAPSLTVFVETGSTLDIEPSISDADGDDVFLEIVSQPLNGIVSVDGSRLVYTPDADFLGNDSFTYIANDSLSPSPVATVDISVLNSNVPSLATTSTAQAPVEVLTLTLGDGQVDDAPTDVSSLSILTLNSSVPVEQLEFRLVGPGVDNVVGTLSNGSVIFDNLTISLAEGSTESYTVFAYFNDPSNISDSHLLNLIFEGSSAVTVADNSTTVIANSVSRLTPVSVDAVELRFINEFSNLVSGEIFSPQPEVAAVDQFGNIDFDFNDVVTLSETSPGELFGELTSSVITGIARFSDVGYNATLDSETLVIVANDSDFEGSLTPATASTSVELIESGNASPVITGIPLGSVQEDATYSFTPAASDADGDGLTFSIQNAPSWTSFNAQTGTLSGTPRNADVGVTTGIVISVSDGIETVSLSAFSIQVVNVNDRPSISGSPSTSVIVPGSYSFTPTATDVDAGASLTFSVTNQPSWASFNAQTGTLGGTPAESDAGTYSGIVISVSDGALSASLPAFSIEVTSNNEAPEITGAPSISVESGETYSFTPSAVDADDDELTFSISNLPTWAVFDTTSGTLSGIPDEDDVGTTSGIVISVSDGALSASLPAFSIEVTNTNEAPEITGTPSISVESGETYSFTPSAVDADDDELTFSISNLPAWAVFDSTSGTLSGTPDEDDVGTTSGIVISVSDGALSASLPAFSIEVVEATVILEAVNDSFTFEQNDQGIYALDVLANDVGADELTIEGVSTSIGQVSIDNNVIVLTLNRNFVGDLGLRYVVSDSSNERQSANVELTITGELEELIPVITVPDNVVVNATGLLTQVNLGVATAIDPVTNNSVPVFLVNNTTVFEPGRHTVVWRAESADGAIAEATQQVDVVPIVSIEPGTLASENSNIELGVFLNGESPEYPLTIPYTISGSAESGSDFNALSGQVIIRRGDTETIRIRIRGDQEVEGTETLIITLDSSLNTSVSSQAVVSISEENVAPDVDLSVSQNGSGRFLISGTGGNVTVAATVEDPNGDDVSFEWFSSDGVSDLSAEDTTFVFDPSGLEIGVYQIGLLVRDNGSPSLSSEERVNVVVIPSLPVLTQADTDGDLIPDDQEGLGDTDMDGIPDYLDSNNRCNVVPQQVDSQSEFLVETPTGVCLRRGMEASTGGAGGLALSQEEADERFGTDPEAMNVGGIFDFEVNNLPETGESYDIVIPQRQPLPAGAIYRKFRRGEWTTFVIDANNSVSSAAGSRGICPPPGNSAYTSGLTEGHWCVQLSIQDGGPNDDDGTANGAIVDPGGISVMLNGNSQPVAIDDEASTLFNQQLEIQVLENDTDEDGDILSILSASANFGEVSIIDETTLVYVPSSGFVGEDSIVYLVSDRNGGTSSAQVIVTVMANSSPSVAGDAANTNHRTAIEIDALANDSDFNGDALTIIDASVDAGEVTITEEQTLLYTPELLFNGQATIIYLVSDGFSQVSGEVLVEVQGNRAPTAVDDSASTNNETSIIINVLNNDTDEDSDSLVVTQASVDFGSVQLNDNNSVTYIPSASFEGVATISYTIDDGFEGTDNGTVTIQVTSAEEARSGSGGGTSSLLWMVMLLAGAVIRRTAVLARTKP